MLLPHHPRHDSTSASPCPTSSHTSPPHPRLDHGRSTLLGARCLCSLTLSRKRRRSARDISRSVPAHATTRFSRLLRLSLTAWRLSSSSVYQAQLSKRGAYLPVVSTVAEATHVVLDVDCAASQWLRTGHRDDQHVVSLEWVKDSFLDGASADESLYRVNPGVAGADVVGVSGKGGSGGEQASSGGGSAGEVGEGREGSALVHEEDDTSGSDESREIRSEDEVEIK